MNPEEFEKGIEQALALYDEGKPLQVIYGLFPRQKEALEEVFAMIQWMESERESVRPRPELLRETLDKLVFIDEARAVQTGSEPLSFSSLQKILPMRKQGDRGTSNEYLSWIQNLPKETKKFFTQKPKVAWGSLGGVCVAMLLFVFIGSDNTPVTNTSATNTLMAVRNDEQVVPEATFAKVANAPEATRAATDSSLVEILRASAEDEKNILNGAENDIDFLDPGASLVESIDTLFVANFDSNMCSSITTTQASFDKKISTLKTTFQKSFDERTASLEDQRDARYEALKAERASRDKAFEAALVALRSKAKDSADKTSIETFEELVSKLQSERGKKIDAAMATYRAGIDASMKRRQTAVADALLTFDAQIEKAFIAAAKTCKTDSAEARATLQKTIVSDRATLQKNIGSKDAMKPVLDSLENARDKGVESANATYNEGLDQSIHTLPLF